MCHFVCCYLIGPECFWWQSLLPSAGQEFTMPLSESVLSAFNVVWLKLFIQGEWEKERERDSSPTVESVQYKSTPANTLETNQSSSTSQLFFPTLLPLLCSGGWQESPSLSLFTQLSIPYFIFLSFLPFFLHTCTHVYRFTHTEHSSLSSIHMMDLQRAFWASLTVLCSAIS